MADRVPGPLRLTRPAGAGTAALKALVRELLDLDESQTVVVQQLACAEPGCPPLETVVAVLSPAAPPRRWKLHKPLSDITGDDIRAALTEGEPQMTDNRVPVTVLTGFLGSGKTTLLNRILTEQLLATGRRGD